jgi:hypothetical protein
MQNNFKSQFKFFVNCLISSSIAFSSTTFAQQNSEPPNEKQMDSKSGINKEAFQNAIGRMQLGKSNFLDLDSEPNSTEPNFKIPSLQDSLQSAMKEAYQKAVPVQSAPIDLGKIFEPEKETSFLDKSKGFMVRKDTQSLLRFMALQHVFRLTTEAETREMTFTSKYFSNYWEGVKGIKHMRWADGDDFKTNVVGHGLQGAVYFMIFWVNGQARTVPVDAKSAKFWKEVFGASWKTALASLFFEFGPFLSETAIGGLGGKRHCMPVEKFKIQYPLEMEKYRTGERATTPRNSNCDHGFVDLVFTPAIGTGIAILELLKDKYVVQKLKASKNKALRTLGVALGYSNFATVMAQTMSLHPPTGSLGTTTSWRGALGGKTTPGMAGAQVGVSIPVNEVGKGIKKFGGLFKGSKN